MRTRVVWKNIGWQLESKNWYQLDWHVHNTYWTLIEATAAADKLKSIEWWK